MTGRGNLYFFIWTPFRPPTNWAKLYKGIPRKYKGKLWKRVIWKFLCFKTLRCYFMTSGCNPEVQTVLLTPILPYSSMTYVRCHIYVNYVIFGIYDIIDIYGIGHMSWINMVIWVSKEPSRPQDCSQMSFDNIFEV